MITLMLTMRARGLALLILTAGYAYGRWETETHYEPIVDELADHRRAPPDRYPGAAVTAPCLYCGLPLTFEPGKGWVHENGQLYITRPDGRDDHCATPDRRAS